MASGRDLVVLRDSSSPRTVRLFPVLVQSVWTLYSHLDDEDTILPFLRKASRMGEAHHRIQSHTRTLGSPQIRTHPRCQAHPIRVIDSSC